MYCPNCGKKLTDGARFCTSCGIKIQEKNIKPKDRAYHAHEDKGRAKKAGTPGTGHTERKRMMFCPYCGGAVEKQFVSIIGYVEGGPGEQHHGAEILRCSQCKKTLGAEPLY